MADMEPQVTLRSLDEKSLSFSKKAAVLSVTIKELIEDLGETDIPIPVKVKSVILEKAMEWAEHHKSDFQETVEEGKKVLNEWDTNFIKKFTDDEMVDLLLAANYLHMKPLLDLASIQVASLVKGKSPQELRQVLNRTNKPKPDDLESAIPGAFRRDGNKDVGSHSPKRAREE